MSPWGAAPQWCSVTVDVGQRFVYGLCVPLPYCFSHTGAISSYVYYVEMTFFLKIGLAVGWFPLLSLFCLGAAVHRGRL